MSSLGQITNCYGTMLAKLDFRMLSTLLISSFLIELTLLN